MQATFVRVLKACSRRPGKSLTLLLSPLPLGSGAFATLSSSKGFLRPEHSNSLPRTLLSKDPSKNNSLFAFDALIASALVRAPRSGAENQHLRNRRREQE